MRELELRKIAAVNQRLVRIEYKGLVFEEPLRFDVLMEDCLLLDAALIMPTRSRRWRELTSLILPPSPERTKSISPGQAQRRPGFPATQCSVP
jgi:hypothetical protein